MAVDLSRVNPKKVANRRALQRYAEFWAALHAVGEAVVAAEKVAGKAADAQPVKASKSAGRRHWAAPDPDEMKSAAKKADTSLRIITKSAKKFESELIARDWRS